jgi:hypothetical protein
MNYCMKIVLKTIIKLICWPSLAVFVLRVI